MRYFGSVLIRAISIVVLFGLALTSPLCAQPPGQSGPHVFRGESYNWWMFDANGMVVFVGVDVPAYCAGETVVGSWKFQLIENPADIELIMSVIKGDDLPTYIYPATAWYNDEGFPDPFKLCEYDYFYGAIAAGTSDAIYTDNDGAAAFYTRPRANSWGVSAHGVLYTQEDEPIDFSGGFRCVLKFNQNPDKAWAKCSNRLSLGD